MMKRLGLAAALFLFLAPALSCAVECSATQFRDKRYTICEVDLARERLQLFLRDDSGSPFTRFKALQRHLDARGEQLEFAMNAGMYHPDGAPVGLYVAEGKQLAPLNTAPAGNVNFLLKPNGVFYVSTAGAGILTTERYAQAGVAPQLATQSGPMLLIDGQVHPRFLPDSDSLRVRNGVGIVAPQRVVFAISDGSVNFYEFALFFRDYLHCRDALFLDGSISSLYSAQLQRDDELKPMGPIIGVTQSRR
ncbi:MAG TPA: phosphodiester glycosidase family protein [Burkholderiales bacterium]|jgi:uncharacterized protein YigE (DUF2233 family)